MEAPNCAAGPAGPGEVGIGGWVNRAEVETGKGGPAVGDVGAGACGNGPAGPACQLFGAYIDFNKLAGR